MDQKKKCIKIPLWNIRNDIERDSKVRTSRDKQIMEL